jgi:hypothetical protein
MKNKILSFNEFINESTMEIANLWNEVSTLAAEKDTVDPTDEAALAKLESEIAAKKAEIEVKIEEDKVAKANA